MKSCTTKKANEVMKQEKTLTERRNAKRVMKVKGEIRALYYEPKKKMREIPPTKEHTNKPENRRERRAQEKKPKGLWTVA
jgi:hypothetical protein